VLFAHDTEVALANAAALVNTGRGGKELLPDIAALDEFIAAWSWTGSRTHDQAELDAVRRLRPRLERLWDADEDEAAETVNALLRETNALPQLVKHDHWDYHLHATPPDAPLADRMAVDAAPPPTATTCTSTCPRTGPAGSAASPAPTAPTSPPTAPAAPVNWCPGVPGVAPRASTALSPGEADRRSASILLRCRAGS